MLFLNAHSDRIAPGSFQTPVPIPASQPGEPDLVQVCFNKAWLPYVITCLFQLTLSTTWQASTNDDLLAALQAANDLILIFQLAKDGCAIGPTGPEGTTGDDMCCCLRMVDGVLQVLSCGVWTPVDGWNPAAIAPNQPGVGSPQPGPGQCQNFSGVIGPTSPWLLPVPVNAGDVVTITNLNGSWSPTAFTEIWLCPDGNIFFAGVCVDGTSVIDSGAPMPTAPLNGTVLFDGTNYYDVSAAANPNTPVAVTILPGVVNAQLLVRCNFHGGVDPAGQVEFQAQVCNNVAVEWSSVFDFTLNTFSFASANPDGAAVWAAATGFTVTNDATGSIFNNDLFLDFASTQIKHIDLDYVGSSLVLPANTFGRIGSGGTVVINPLLIAGSGAHTATYDDPTGVASTEINFSLGGGGGSGSVVYKKLTLRGTGTKPSNFP